MAKWHYPLDPDCREVREEKRAIDEDPMSQSIPDIVEEMWEEFEDRHRRDCHRCHEYGAANVNIAD